MLLKEVEPGINSRPVSCVSDALAESGDYLVALSLAEPVAAPFGIVARLLDIEEYRVLELRSVEAAQDKVCLIHGLLDCHGCRVKIYAKVDPGLFRVAQVLSKAGVGIDESRLPAAAAGAEYRKVNALRLYRRPVDALVVEGHVNAECACLRPVLAKVVKLAVDLLQARAHPAESVVVI